MGFHRGVVGKLAPMVGSSSEAQDSRRTRLLGPLALALEKEECTKKILRMRV